MEHDISIIELLLFVMLIWFSIGLAIISNSLLIIADLLKGILDELKTNKIK